MEEQQADTYEATASTPLNRRKLFAYVAPLGISAALASLSAGKVAAASFPISHANRSTASLTHTPARIRPHPATPRGPHGTVSPTVSSMWMQGNALTVENPASVAKIDHVGWGTTVYGISGQSSWFHIPVPSPVVLNNRRPSLSEVFLMFDIGPNMGFISNVHLYDGGYPFKQFDGLQRIGNHRTAPDSYNTFALGAPHPIYQALGISFKVHFTGRQPWMTVSGAGGNFYMP
jgi:hypothetical protein